MIVHKSDKFFLIIVTLYYLGHTHSVKRDNLEPMSKGFDYSCQMALLVNKISNHQIIF